MTIEEYAADPKVGLVVIGTDGRHLEVVGVNDEGVHVNAKLVPIGRRRPKGGKMSLGSWRQWCKDGVVSEEPPDWSSREEQCEGCRFSSGHDCGRGFLDHEGRSVSLGADGRCLGWLAPYVAKELHQKAVESEPLIKAPPPETDRLDVQEERQVPPGIKSGTGIKEYEDFERRKEKLLGMTLEQALEILSASTAASPPVELVLEPEPEKTLNQLLQEKQSARRRERIQAPTTRKSNWLSDVGHPCLRYHVYWRTQGHKAKPTDEGLMGVFEKGSEEERLVVAELAQMGMELYEREMNVALPALDVTGRIDGSLARGARGHERTVIDIKSVDARRFDKLKTLDDVLNASKGYVRKWVNQVEVGAKALERTKCGILFRNKTNGNLWLVEWEKSEEREREVIERLDALHGWLGAYYEADEGAEPLPDRIHPDEGWCEDCAHAHHCNPDEPYRTPLLLTEDPKFTAGLDRLMEIDEQRKEANRIGKKLKDRLKKTEGDWTKIIAGDVLIERSEAGKITFKKEADNG